MSKRPPPAIFAVDPGAKSGYAVVTCELSPRLLYFGVVKAKETSVTGLVEGVLKCMAKDFPGVEIERGVIEDQYLGVVKRRKKGAKAGEEERTMIPQSMKKVARVAGRWQEAFLRNGIPYREDDDDIHPQSWQSKELGTGSRKGRDVLRQQCAAKVAGLYGGGRVKIPENADSAVLIARYRAIEVGRKLSQGVLFGSA